MKTLSLMTIGLILSTSSSFAGDCLEAAIQFRHDLHESLSAMESRPGFIERNNQFPNSPEHSHTFSLKSEIYRQSMLIELYSYANQEKCEGQVKDLFDSLAKRAKRKSHGKRAFDLPTCSTLMARIDRGRTGEFCPIGKTIDFDIDRIKKTIESENRRRKK